jgi:hypothetical protein
MRKAFLDDYILRIVNSLSAYYADDKSRNLRITLAESVNAAKLVTA